MNVLEGTFQAAGLRFGIVVARFNDVVTRRLLAGAEDGLRRHGAAADAVDVAWVPGAVEVPLVAKRMAASGRYHAIIALGAVVRGATSHYDQVCSMVASGVARAALDTGVPVVFGVLTTDTMDQAIERSGGKGGNKGFEAAMGAVEMATLLATIDA